MLAKLELQFDYREDMGRRGIFIPALPDAIRYLKRKLWREEIP